MSAWREVQTHAPAAGEVGHGSSEISVSKAETGKQGSRTSRRAVARDLVQARVQFADQMAVVRSFRGCQRALDRPQFDVAIERVLERRRRQRGRFLRDEGNGPPDGDFTVAEVCMQLAAQKREQAGLSAAIRADEADAPAWVDLERGVFDQAAGAAGEGEVAKLNHG